MSKSVSGYFRKNKKKKFHYHLAGGGGTKGHSGRNTKEIFFAASLNTNNST